MVPLTRQQITARYKDAQAKQARGLLDQAQEAYEALLAVAPTLAEAHFQLHRIALVRGDTDAAGRHLDAALSLKPKVPALLQAAVAFHEAHGTPDQALAAYDALIAADPKAIKPQADKALYLQSQGAFDAAEKIFRKLLRQNPYDGELYRVFLGTKKLRPADPLVLSMRKAYAHPRMSEAGKMHLGFALAKVSEDNGQYDKVFGYLNKANALQQKAAPFDAAARDAELAAMLAAQDVSNFDPMGAVTEPRPVFVTGMPRSGTTLVEQIIASHSGATAGGEMGHALRLARDMFGATLSMTRLDEIADDALDAYATAYRAAIMSQTGATRGVVTDKSIQSHLIFGLIRRALPGARIIVVQRDPRDIAVSIYKNHFKLGTHRYANDLGDIARAIAAFRRTVATWQARMPGHIHEVHYEALVADPEDQSRALIAAADLDWEPGVRDFHKAGGTVKTLSLHQVRQPIYRGSAEAWRRYEADLAPFMAAWEKEDLK